ncbi:unnamed protein product [Cylindrotheca closterium]|uniref:Uncharacterized protein n=1 Tax=Cylindrotheca closterium TaxID=2856 RepID=A0AAD2CX27_9STRA|nr:unnamed protein product [Cylindrotheca closterium]
MALTTLNAQQWQDIMSPVLQVCLPKSGVCRNFPRLVVFAPVDYQGLGVPHPFGKQVYKHLEMILRHMSGGTKTGAYMDANLQAHQLETGTSFGLLQQDYQNTSILASDTWLKRVWKELESLDMTTFSGLTGAGCSCNDSDDDSSDDNPNESSGSKGGQFTEVWSKKAATKVKKKAKEKKKLITDNENPFLNDLSPAQRKMAEVADRKLKNDQVRHKPGPLFLMVLPGEMEGTYILVCREKFKQLARNVLKGLVPFLTHHLYEPTLTKTDQALRKWVPQSEISMAQHAVEEALEFLDNVMEDATDVYDGQLSIDLDMANNKDIDDGKIVTGMMDKMQEPEQQLEDAFNEIEIWDNALEAQERALAQQRADNAALQAQLAAL